MSKLPEGVELDLHFYVVSEALDTEGKVSLRGNVTFPVPGIINANALASAAGLPEASDWRLMTPREVEFHKAQGGV